MCAGFVARVMFPVTDAMEKGKDGREWAGGGGRLANN